MQIEETIKEETCKSTGVDPDNSEVRVQSEQFKEINTRHSYKVDIT